MKKIILGCLLGFFSNIGFAGYIPVTNKNFTLEFNDPLENTYVSFRMYDAAVPSSTYSWIGFNGWGSGAYRCDLLDSGWGNNPSGKSSYHYQIYTIGGGQTNGVRRHVGWHDFKFVFSGATVSYYIDGTNVANFVQYGGLTNISITANGSNLLSDFYIDAAELTVSSDIGLPTPHVGKNLYKRSSIMTCFAPDIVVDKNILWKNIGWIGSGDIPSSGSSNTTGEIALTNDHSSITWKWQIISFDAVAVTNLVVQQRSGTKLVDITYDIISDLTNAVPITLQIKNGAAKVSSTSSSGDLGVTVLPGVGRQILWNVGADWNGNASDLTFTVLHMSAIDSTKPSGMVRIPSGTNSGADPDFGAYSLVITNSFFMDETEVTKAQWDTVRTWAVTNGYSFDNAGFGKASNHPVYAINWYDAIKWCNARSEIEGRTPVYTISGRIYKSGRDTPNFDVNVAGYRLPTSAEWQYAARGGLSGTRFPWGDTVNHSNANYRANRTAFVYDTSPYTVHTVHPSTTLPDPRTLPVRFFDPNGFGLSDMSGNIWEWCWDSSGTNRASLGGAWSSIAESLRCGHKTWIASTVADHTHGFRTASTEISDLASPALMSDTCALVDTRDYALSVYSDIGIPVPAIGTTLYAWSSTVTCSVKSSAIEGSTNWICSGWEGSGSIPVLGEGYSTGPIVLTNLSSSITWLWPMKTVADLWVENVFAVQRPGTKLVDVTYDVHSTETNTVEMVLSVSDSTNTVAVFAVSGDSGSEVVTGIGKTLIWDAGADWNSNFDNLTFRILGQDAQGAGVATPVGRVRVPAGQNTGTDPDSGAYSLTVSNSFFMDAGEVTKAQWAAVYNWAITNGYSFDNAGSATASNHPVYSINWIDAAKWCNARSQMEGFVPCYNTNTWSCDISVNGYRLPTVEEWQYAARGGLSGKRFPWGDTITHSNDVYYSSASYAYDESVTRGFHPLFGAGTAPAGRGTTNGYGLTEMSGNVMEWCNDLSGANRVLAGGSWDQYASEARCAYTSLMHPSAADYNIGFRTVQRASSSTSAETDSAISVDTRDYLLVVESAHGSPVPNIGTNVYSWRASVTCSVESSVISGLTNWTSAGWSGSGSVSASGSTPDTGSFVLADLVSSIVWNWNTNYWMETVTSGEGQVTGGNRWFASGSNAAVSANPSNGWLFMGWSGDASGDYTETNIIIPMVRPVSVTATFSDDADGDGLLNTNETALGTDPRRRDSDDDGMDDPHELIAGTAPTNRASVLDIQLNLTGSANELTWYGVSGRYYRLEYTDVLGGTWLPKGSVVSGANGQVMRLDVGAGSNRFYRIRVSNSPGGF
jgi:formylglycine-generating enzyme required for sulfatase activity